MKKKIWASLLSGLALLALAVGLSGCGSKSTATADKVVKVGVIGTTDDKIWKQVQTNLKGDHIKIKLVRFTDGILANESMNNKELDLVAFQNNAFLNQEEKEKGYKFSVLANTYLTPMNIFSSKLKSIKDLKSGDKVSIPNNVTNAGRALKVLEQAGLIKIDPKAGFAPAIKDITQNKLKLQIVQQDPAKIMSLLPDVAAGITNSNFVKAAGKDPVKDAIYTADYSFSNSANKPWINVIAARTADKNSTTLKKVIKAYQTKSVVKVYNTDFKNMYVAAFKPKN